MRGVDYEEIFEKAEVGIALNDPETGTVGKVNEHYAHLLGYARTDLRSMAIGEISADDPAFDQAMVMDKIEDALEGEPQTFDWLFERRDGSRFWGEVVLKRTRIGDSDRLLAFVRDISDRKQYERELEQTNRRLEEFASLISHDLRNPLNVAMGHLDLATNECENEHLDIIDRSLTRMETLIEDMLTLAQQGDSAADPERVALSDVVTDAWQTVQTESACLAVETDATIRADRRRLQQLFENLVRNAVEHGGEDVTVRVGDRDAGFYFEDTGSGIPEAERDRVLDPGYSTAARGTGLGLGIVRDIAETHGWTMTVTEGAEDGARFNFTEVQKGEDTRVDE